MRKILTSLCFAALVGFQLNCKSETAANNTNQTNVNASPTANVNANQTNANVVTQATPLPTFTNADEALAVGKKLLEDSEPEKAVEALQQATKLNPDLAEAYFNLGIAYALIEKIEQENAPPIGTTPTSPTPTPTVIRNKQGKKEIVAPPTESEKAFGNAVKAYKKILAKNPKDDVAHYNLGRSYNKLNQDPEALKSLQQAVKLKPDDTEYQTELGIILIKLAQYDEAVAALKKAIQIDETNLQAESLLEKAEAGKKRVDFGNKPKTPQQQQQQTSGKQRSTPKDDEGSTAKAVSSPPAPPTKNANQK